MQRFFGMAMLWVGLVGIGSAAMAQDDFDPDAVLAMEYEAFADAVTAMLREGDDGRLELIAQRARETRARWDTGLSKLSSFYAVFDSFYESLPATGKYRYKQTLKSYIDENPELITPRVALVTTYITDAWEARGSGWASSVTEEGWAGFHNNLETAVQVAEDARKIEAKDPELFNQLITIGGALSRPDSEMYAYAWEGLKINPEYYDIVLTMANYALPRWGGGRDAERKLAEWATEETKDRLGDAMYFVVARYVGDVEGEAAAIKLFGLEWPRIKSGYADYREQNAHDPRLSQMAALFACIAGDKEAAEQYFADGGDQAYRTVWTHEAMAHWREWVAGEAEPLEYTEFHMAAQYGNVEHVKQAIGAVDDIHAMDPHGKRAIDYAYALTDWPLMEFLVDQGINVDASETALVGVLNSAAGDNRDELVNKLLDGGLDARRADALWYAAREGNAGLVRTLLDKGGCDPDHVIHKSTTPLTRAANKGHFDVVKLLVERGADVNLESSDGWTPFLMAVWEGHGDVAQFLVDHGADPNGDTNGWNALHLAASKGHANTLRLAMTVSEHDVNSRVEDGGYTPLHLAAHEGHTTCVQALLENPACEMDAVQDEHGTALMTAAGEGHYDVVRLLVEKGANLEATDRGGRTALTLAKRNNRKEVAEYLQAKGATE